MVKKCNGCKWHWVRLFDGKKCCYNEKSKYYHDEHSNGCNMIEIEIRKEIKNISDVNLNYK